jgi:hypothetical protein
MQQYKTGVILGRHWLAVILLATGACAGHSPLSPQVGAAALSLEAERVAWARGNELRVADLERLSRPIVTVPGEVPPTRLSWSPDGQRLAFWRDGELWLLEGTQPRRVWQVNAELISEPLWQWIAFWDPSGALMALRTEPGIEDELYEVGARGSANKSKGKVFHALDTVEQVIFGRRWMAVISRDSQGAAVDFTAWGPNQKYEPISEWTYTFQDHRIRALSFDESGNAIYARMTDSGRAVAPGAGASHWRRCKKTADVDCWQRRAEI